MPGGWRIRWLSTITSSPRTAQLAPPFALGLEQTGVYIRGGGLPGKGHQELDVGRAESLLLDRLCITRTPTTWSWSRSGTPSQDRKPYCDAVERYTGRGWDPRRVGQGQRLAGSGANPPPAEKLSPLEVVARFITAPSCPYRWHTRISSSPSIRRTRPFGGEQVGGLHRDPRERLTAPWPEPEVIVDSHRIRQPPGIFLRSRSYFPQATQTAQ